MRLPDPTSNEAKNRSRWRLLCALRHSWSEVGFTERGVLEKCRRCGRTRLRKISFEEVVARHERASEEVYARPRPTKRDPNICEACGVAKGSRPRCLYCGKPF